MSDKEKDEEPPIPKEPEDELRSSKGPGKFIQTPVDELPLPKGLGRFMFEDFDKMRFRNPTLIEFLNTSLELSRQITEYNLETQKDILKSIWVPFIEEAQNVTKQNFNLYLTMIKAIAENFSRTKQFTNNLLRSNLEANKS